ncbi:hypothetical protein V2G26_013640 [Clonostachys chloroleuca]
MKSFTFLLPFASVATAICHYGTSLGPRNLGLAERAEGSFGYHELEGAINWHALDSKNKLCATGKAQSPINVVRSERTIVPGRSYDLNIPSYPYGAPIQNLGTTVQTTVNGSATILNDPSYVLRQFHFHTPSEHHLDGEHFAGEVHFVFENGNKKLAVIGFFIEIAGGSDQPTQVISNALDGLGAIPEAGQQGVTNSLDFAGLREHLRHSDVYQYGGSLTTPPCSEEVTFNVAAKPIYVSADKYRALKRIVKFNSRFTQNKPGEENILQVVSRTVSRLAQNARRRAFNA